MRRMSISKPCIWTCSVQGHKDIAAGYTDTEIFSWSISCNWKPLRHANQAHHTGGIYPKHVLKENVEWQKRKVAFWSAFPLFKKKKLTARCTICYNAVPLSSNTPWKLATKAKRKKDKPKFFATCCEIKLHTLRYRKHDGYLLPLLNKW